MIGIEKSLWLIYSNTHLRTRETLPLISDANYLVFFYFFFEISTVNN